MGHSDRVTKARDAVGPIRHWDQHATLWQAGSKQGGLRTWPGLKGERGKGKEDWAEAVSMQQSPAYALQAAFPFINMTKAHASWSV